MVRNHERRFQITAAEALFLSNQAEVVKWVNSCCKLFPQELNLAPAAALNVLGGGPELMNHPGGYRQEQKRGQGFCAKVSGYVSTVSLQFSICCFSAFRCVAAWNHKSSKLMHLYLGPQLSFVPL